MLEPPEPPVNITLDPDTSGATWIDEGYGGEAATYLLYDGDTLAVAVDSIDPLLRRRLLFTDDYDRRELKGGKDKNRTRGGGGGGGGGKNRDGSERTWNSKRGWRPVWKSIFYCAFAESSRRPPRHRRDACSMACTRLTG